MPIYDYRCRDCGHDFYVVETLAEHDDHRSEKPGCPECGSSAVERRVTAPNVHTAKKS